MSASEPTARYFVTVESHPTSNRTFVNVRDAARYAQDMIRRHGRAAVDIIVAEGAR